VSRDSNNVNKTQEGQQMQEIRTEERKMRFVDVESSMVQDTEVNAEPSIVQDAGEEGLKIEKHELVDRTVEQKSALVDMDFYIISKGQRTVLDMTIAGGYITQRKSDGAFFVLKPFSTIKGKAKVRISKDIAAPLIKKGLLVEAQYQEHVDEFGLIMTDIFSYENVEALNAQKEESEKVTDFNAKYRAAQNVVKEQNQRLMAIAKQYVALEVRQLFSDNIQLLENVLSAVDIQWEGNTNSIRIQPMSPGSPTLLISTDADLDRILCIEFLGGFEVYLTSTNTRSENIRANTIMLEIAQSLTHGVIIERVLEIIKEARSQIKRLYELEADLSAVFDDKDGQKLCVIIDKITAL